MKRSELNLTSKAHKVQEITSDKIKTLQLSRNRKTSGNMTLVE